MDLSVGDFLVYEFFGGPSFGTFGDFDGVTYESLVTSAGTPYRVELALRFYDYGDPRTFWLTAPAVIEPLGSWTSYDVFSTLFIQAGEFGPPPASFADIPADAPLVGIHLRAAHWSGPWVGYGDNVSLSFAGEATTYNFEVAPVPEPATVVLFGSGATLLAGARRRRRRERSDLDQASCSGS